MIVPVESGGSLWYVMPFSCNRSTSSHHRYLIGDSLRFLVFRRYGQCSRFQDNFLHFIVVYHIQEFAIVKILGSNSPKGIVQKSHHHQADEEADQDNEYRLSVFRSSPGAVFWFPVLIFSIVHAFPPCMSNRPSFFTDTLTLTLYRIPS